MTPEEIKYMMKTLQRPVKIDKVWSKAFELYNNNHKVKLHQGCKPCYFKVLKYHKEL